MSRELRSPSFRSTHRRHNFAAAIVAGGAIAFLYYNFNFPSVTAQETHSLGPQLSNMAMVANIPRREPVVRQTASLDDQSNSQNNAEAPSAPSSAQIDSMADRYAILFVISQLQRGIEKLERYPSYSAVFERQERIAGELQDQQQIEMKLRHAPFSVYMKWLNGDKGRELLYSANEHEGKMLVKLGGLRGRLVPTLKIELDSERATAESRHPVSQAGLLYMAREIIHQRQKDLQSGNVPHCEIEEGHEFDGRPCYKLVIESREENPSSIYRKAIMLIDSELSLPVYVRNYTWPNENTVDLETETLIECYCYTNIQLEDQLAEAIWQHDNPAYRFKR